MNLEDLEIYRPAMKLGEKIWQIVEKWDYFQKDTIGRQWVKAGDSIAANISEGFGRYYYKETRPFTYYARGSNYGEAKLHAEGINIAPQALMTAIWPTK